MPQLRRDPVTGRWVIINVENPKSNTDFHVPKKVRSSKICPFCPGNESMTPPAISEYSHPAGQAPWGLRVIPNKFPALKIEEKADKQAVGMYDKIGGFGAHEVLIENPRHDAEVPDLALPQVELIFRAYRDRFLDLKRDPRFKYILIFKNYGPEAGASLEHPHSQLIGLPIVPSRVQGEIKGALEHYQQTDRCLFCDIIAQENNQKKLCVDENECFIALTPFASRFPFETWLMPKFHQASFDLITDEEISRLAKTYQAVLSKLRLALGDPSFNVMLHTIPVHSKDHEVFHWHIEIIPHLTQVAGFELGTGFYLNPTPSEVAAEALRNS